jgi:ribulose-phosphate 3-epimerase
MKKIKIAPSILSADFTKLGEQVKEASKGGADYVHVDVMDGQFVPNITVGPLAVEAVNRCVKLPIDAHLMIERPWLYTKEFKSAGSDIITVQEETCRHLHKTLQEIKDSGAKAGVALNPSTSVSAIENVLGDVDLILIMTVNPGFSGQKFIHSMLPKIEYVRDIKDTCGFRFDVEVDGGINSKTAGLVSAAGANVLVAGSAIFCSKEGVAKSIKKIREAAEDALKRS